MDSFTCIDFELKRNDIVAKISCQCPKYPTNDFLKHIKKEHALWGYNDDYFFKVVNKDPKETVLSCGCNIKYQWTKTCLKIWKQ
jgi:hypothetical protein